MVLGSGRFWAGHGFSRAIALAIPAALAAEGLCTDDQCAASRPLSHQPATGRRVIHS
jgi:hypothetical protein